MTYFCLNYFSPVLIYFYKSVVKDIFVPKLNVLVKFSTKFLKIAILSLILSLPGTEPYDYYDTFWHSPSLGQSLTTTIKIEFFPKSIFRLFDYRFNFHNRFWGVANFGHYCYWIKISSMRFLCFAIDNCDFGKIVNIDNIPFRFWVTWAWFHTVLGIPGMIYRGLDILSMVTLVFGYPRIQSPWVLDIPSMNTSWF